MIGNVVISEVHAITYVVLSVADNHFLNEAWHKPKLL